MARFATTARFRSPTPAWAAKACSPRTGALVNNGKITISDTGSQDLNSTVTLVPESRLPFLRRLRFGQLWRRHQPRHNHRDRGNAGDWAKHRHTLT